MRTIFNPAIENGFANAHIQIFNRANLQMM